MFYRRLLPLLCLTALLAGCTSSPRLVESNVASFSTLTALPTPPTYRMERLLSQQANSALWEPIETQAQQALDKLGLQRVHSDASLIVQVGAFVQIGATQSLAPPPTALRSPWASYYYSLYYTDPFGPFGWGWSRFGISYMMIKPFPQHHRAVTLVLRNAASGQVVYETFASHEDVWTDDPAIYGVLFEQALSDFPQPPSGPRVVSTPMP